MVKINNNKNILHSVQISRDIKSSKTDNSKFDISSTKALATDCHIGKKDIFLEALRNSPCIESAVKSISDQIANDMFNSSSVFFDEDFISQVKNDLFEYFKDDPLAQDMLLSLK